ncbi:MAG: phosphate ABC transporter permease subunit PstC [Saprospiraceae bacterium]
MKTTRRHFAEMLRKKWMQAMLALILCLPFAIGISLLLKSWPLLSLAEIRNILFTAEWMPTQGQFGMLTFIVSSVAVSLIGLVLMIPVCLASSIYITQFASPWLSRRLRSVIDILAGIPSVIFGLWGVITVVPWVAELAAGWGARNTTGFSILAAGIVVAVSVMPFVLNMLIELFESVSLELKETALSLGASHWQAVRDVILKKLKPGIIAAFTLGESKAFGETIAVLMVVGNVVQRPRGLFDAGYPLPSLLANNYGEMMSIPLYDAALMLSALILLLIVIAFNFLAHRLIRLYTSPFSNQ